MVKEVQMLSGMNIAVVDLETEKSADDVATGWNDKVVVGFNSKSFDMVLMRALLRREAEVLRFSDSGEDLFRSGVLVDLCDRFKILCSTSYDVLESIWQVEPQGKFERGLNS